MPTNKGDKHSAKAVKQHSVPQQKKKKRQLAFCPVGEGELRGKLEYYLVKEALDMHRHRNAFKFDEETSY